MLVRPHLLAGLPVAATMGIGLRDLRDASGVVQVVIREDDRPTCAAKWCIAVTGAVRVGRTERQRRHPTGQVEVVTERLEVLNESIRCRSQSTSTAASVKKLV